MALPISGLCDDITQEIAAKVAAKTIENHIRIYGDWNGQDTACPLVPELIIQEDTPVAYNFPVNPSGHVMVAYTDDFSPVLLYSATSAFNSSRKDNHDAVESWIIKEIAQNRKEINRYNAQASESALVRAQNHTHGKNRILSAWANKSADTRYINYQTDTSTDISKSTERSATTVGPLLTTTWSQSSPYYLYTPDDNCVSGHTVTGCVATAFAQIAKYWEWPPTGTGSHTYTWNSQTLSADFNHTYNWDLMPDHPTDSSSAEEKDAIARLMSDMGIATDMNYGCSGSGSSAFANNILDVYFRYKTSMQLLSRDSGYTSDTWFALFKSELDADPPRPMAFSIFSGSGGHEVVVDGYQTGDTDMVHINYGWNGSYDGFYNITNNFIAYFEWNANGQYVVTGIEPDNTPPTADAGSDQSVDEGAGVTLSGSGNDPDGAAIASYAWSQTSGPSASLSGSNTGNATFKAPDVDSTGQMIFTLTVTDSMGASATDTCTITVDNVEDAGEPATDSSDSQSATSASSTGGGGGGGCFISTIF